MARIEFLLHVQERHPGIPVVVMSGGGSASKEFLLADARQLGAVAVLAKPLTREMVEEVIRSILGGPTPN